MIEAIAARPFRFSLHRACTPQQCGLCDVRIPVRRLPDYAEYWRVKGGPSGTPRVLCCLCHALWGLPTDGWEVHPDGREVMSAAVPVEAVA